MMKTKWMVAVMMFAACVLSSCGGGKKQAQNAEEAVAAMRNTDYYEGGTIARRGNIIQPVIDYLMQDEYLSKTYPKSTGREKYSNEFLNNIISKAKQYTSNNDDIITTITAYTAETIIDQINRFCKGIKKLVVAGGGANNEYILAYLKSKLNIEVAKSNINDEMEAIGFAMLGYATINNMPSNVKAVTGARDNVILGNITKAPKVSGV